MVGVAITLCIQKVRLAPDAGGISSSNCSEVTMSPKCLDMSMPREISDVPLTEGHPPCMWVPSWVAESKGSACEKTY